MKSGAEGTLDLRGAQVTEQVCFRETFNLNKIKLNNSLLLNVLWLSIETYSQIRSLQHNTFSSQRKSHTRTQKSCKMNSHKIGIMCQNCEFWVCNPQESRVSQVIIQLYVQSNSVIISRYIRYSSIYRLSSETRAGLNCWILVSVTLEHDSQGYADFDSAVSSSLQWLAGKMLCGSKSAILEKCYFPKNE